MDQRLTLKSRCRVLLCLLTVAWILPANAAVAAVPTERLQSLVDDAAAQFQLAYRQHPVERERRREQLAAVLAAWRAAARSEANNERLAIWLHATIRSSMPGSSDPLPQVPSFVARAASAARGTGSVVIKQAPAVSDAKTEADPFRDDPATARD